jgi:uncharacterized protein YkuJ
VINSILLYFSINNNIKKTKREIYNYSINIYDAITKDDNYSNNENNNKNDLYKLIIDFYQWFHGKSIEDLLTNITKNNFFKKENNLYNNSIKEYMNKNNIEMKQIDEINKKKKKEEDQKKQEKEKKIENNNINNKTNDILFIDIDKNENSNSNLKNILKLNNKKNKQQENNDIYSIQTSKEDLKLHKYNSNNNDINNNNNSNSNIFIIKKKSSNNIESLNTIEENLRLHHKDYINININPKTSKNININIHLSNDKISQYDFSSSKENNYHFNKRKVGKTALIPKNLMMSNIISEANSLKRKRRQLKSIKIRQNKINLKGTNLPGGSIREAEEVDFSDFEKTGIKIKKSIFFSKNDYSELKYSNFKSKKSFKDIDLDISNSDVERIEENSGDQNIRMSVKNMNGKHVHFAD